jgi:hypothetical protein
VSAVVPELAEWGSFYMVVGSAAGALIGLQFVVLALIADRPPVDVGASAAFATPTIVHFGAALLLSGVALAPWHGTGPVAALLGVVGLAGVAYALLVAWRMRVQTAYDPQLEDWLLHALLPLAAYTTLAAVAFALSSHLRAALFAVAAAALLLLFVGIHNAWDAVTYHLFVAGRGERAGEGRRIETRSEARHDQ